MRPLVAVDVDGTLLPIDSFRKLVLRHLDLPIAWCLARRAVRLSSRAAFAEAVTRRLAAPLGDAVAMDRYARELAADVDARVLDRARRAAGAEGAIVLVSASPEPYIARLAEHLGLHAVASRFVDGTFVHCYGARKRQELEARFPRTGYDYALAIADHPSDAPLLAAFREAVWWDGSGEP